MNHRSGACAGLLLLLAHLGAAATVNLSAAAIEAQVKREGASATVRNLVAEGTYDSVVDKVATGRPEWLKLAMVLSQGTEGFHGIQLAAALSLALERSPEAVLRVLPAVEPHAHGVTEVCSGEALAVFDQPPKHLPNWRRKVEAALRKVGPELKEKRTLCLTSLKRSAQ